MRERLQLLKLNFVSWYSTLSKRKRIAFVSSVSAVGLTLAGLIGYGVYSYWRWNFASSRDWASKFPSTKSVQVEPTEPRDQPAPINGALYTQTEADIFTNRRPLAIMVNNHVDARPQYGLSEADLVYEAVAEGGITRFLALYHAQDSDQVGPVRSARIYYLDWAAEFNAWFAHWGGSYVDKNDPKILDPNFPEPYICDPAADSYAYINKHGIPSLDQCWLGETAYWRDYSRGVAKEHTGYTSTQKLWHEAPNKYPEPGWREFQSFDLWQFKDDASEGERPAAGAFTFNFWEGYKDYEVRWEYDPETNEYLRYQGGERQVDAGNNQEIRAKNIILQFTKQGFFGDKKRHLKYESVGTGKAKIFLDGKVVEAEWQKGAIRERTKFYDAETGEEIRFNRGQIWIEIVPSGGTVTYS